MLNFIIYYLTATPERGGATAIFGFIFGSSLGTINSAMTNFELFIKILQCLSFMVAITVGVLTIINYLKKKK